MPGKRHRPPEFEITEQPYPIGDRSNAGANEIWRIVHQEVERLEERVAEADASLRKANEMNDAAKRRFLLDLIESVMDNLDRILAAADMLQGDARAQGAARRRWHGRTFNRGFLTQTSCFGTWLRTLRTKRILTV